MVIRRSISWFLLLFCMCADLSVSESQMLPVIIEFAVPLMTLQWKNGMLLNVFAAVPDRRNEAFGNARNALPANRLHRLLLQNQLL
jgi:hypothetical protein